MDFKKELMEDLQTIHTDLGNLIEKHRDYINGLLCKEAENADERLNQEVLFRTLQYSQGFCRGVEYMGANVTGEGILGYDKEGNITLNGKRLPLMTDLEISCPDTVLNENHWIRAFVGGVDGLRLIGLDEDMEITGLHARIRG